MGSIDRGAAVRGTDDQATTFVCSAQEPDAARLMPSRRAASSTHSCTTSPSSRRSTSTLLVWP